MMVQAPPVVANVHDRQALESMPRQRLQQLAKKENIKASSKSIEIIHQLLKKYPGGVPRPEKRTIKKPQIIEFKATEYNGTSLYDSSSDESTFESRRYRMDMSAIQHSKEARWRAAKWAGEVARSGEPDYTPVRTPSPVTVPGPKDVREVRRELTRLINEMPSLQADIDSAQALIETAADKLRDSIGTLRELVSTRNAIESSIVQRMKDDKRLWDGTYHFQSDDDMKAWSEFLQDAKEAAQKEEEEEKKRDEIKSAEVRKHNEKVQELERSRAERRAKRRELRIAEDIKLGIRKAPPPPPPVVEPELKPPTRPRAAAQGHKRQRD